MQVTSATSAATSSGAGSAGGASRTGSSARDASLDKTTFLELLMTQMKNQDPLAPMDNTTFLAQLAQFSSLEQMQNLNDKFSAYMAQNQILTNSAAAGLIGRRVEGNASTVSLPSSGSVPLSYSLPQDADSVTLAIADADGNIVATIAGLDASAGTHSVEWNGSDAAGVRLAAGTYTVGASATARDGTSLPASTVVQGLVDGVTYRGGAAYLLVNGQEVALADVEEVYTDGSASK